VLGRDRVFASTMAVTLIAIAGFAVFLFRDYSDSGASTPASVAVTIPQAAGGAAVPASGQEAGAPAATAGATPAPGTTTTVVSGGSGGGQTAGGTSGHAAAAPVGVPKGDQQACQGGVIKIGSIIPITGPVTQQTAADALVAYFKRLNSQGGINGCQVDFKYYDDGGLNNQQAIADAHKLVQDDQVFAVVGAIEPVTTAVTEPYFAQQGVPVVGIEGVGVNEYNSPVEYTFAESPQGFGISTANYANGRGCKHMAVFYLDFDFGVASFNALQDTAGKNGQTVDYKNQESISSNSYGTDTLAAQQNLSKYDPKTACVINILDANSAVREMNAMKGNSWYPNMVVTTSSSDPVVISSEAGDFFKQIVAHGNMIYAQRNYQPAAASIPEVQDWIQTEGQYFPGFDPNSYAEGSWLAAKTFTDVARQLGSGNLTRNNLLNALNNLQGYHNGFTPDLTMTSDHGPNRQVLWLDWDVASGSFKQITPFQPW
jgi:branched-chain amino acid transport system substrate-binding protein